VVTSYATTRDPVPQGAASYAAVPLLEDFLAQTSERTSERLSPVAGVAVTFGVGPAPITIGASTQLALEVDELQYDIGTGPCLHALRTGTSLYVPDLAADDRWNDYGPRAAAMGAASCLSVPVLVQDKPQAVLKVYSGTVDGLDETQRAVVTRVALDIAGGIGLALHLSRHARDLDDRAAAMDRRRTIDLALGMLMERTSCDADAAFTLLRSYSQHYNVRLHLAAAQVVAARDDSRGAREAPFVPDQGGSPGP